MSNKTTEPQITWKALSTTSFEGLGNTNVYYIDQTGPDRYQVTAMLTKQTLPSFEQAKAFCLGVEFACHINSRQVWTTTEDEMLLAYGATYTAQRTGKSLRTCQGRRRRLRMGLAVTKILVAKEN